ncbi:hypothetical protein ATANTOWER_014208 [Ataeniobius toweri]|uniref:Uncharacterized protein n=1 Tax=Ataeniobius toweri TaxID=208326 RepID=A0ABU7A6N9_9TELE|nr:hypothetical protein [Ataeniobius toweri]
MDAHFISNYDLHLLSINLFTCGMIQIGVFGSFLNIPSLMLPLSQLSWNVLQASKFFGLNIKYLIFVVDSVPFRSNRISISLDSVFIQVLQNVQTSLGLVL